MDQPCIEDHAWDLIAGSISVPALVPKELRLTTLAIKWCVHSADVVVFNLTTAQPVQKGPGDCAKRIGLMWAGRITVAGRPAFCYVVVRWCCAEASTL
jgi:hypothetical protein